MSRYKVSEIEILLSDLKTEDLQFSDERVIEFKRRKTGKLAVFTLLSLLVIITSAIVLQMPKRRE